LLVGAERIGPIAGGGVSPHQELVGALAVGLEPHDLGSELRRQAGLAVDEQVRPRCVMTTFDPDTLEQDHRVLRRIVKEFGGAMALDCSVLRGGRVTLGDPVELEPV